MKRVAVIIPCYNEAASIGNVIQSLQNLQPISYLLTPVVVNDCSKDQTADIAAQFSGTVVMDLPVNLGIGGAVQTGMKYALNNGFDYAIQVDGDGQHPVDQIDLLIQPLISQQADVVIGSRFLLNEGFQSTLMRRMGIRYFAKLNRLLTGLQVTDSTSGFRSFNRKALEKIADEYPDDYPEPEAVVMCALHQLRVLEIPVTMMERQGGQSSIGTMNSLYYMVKVTLGILFVYLKHVYGKRSSI